MDGDIGWNCARRGAETDRGRRKQAVRRANLGVGVWLAEERGYGGGGGGVDGGHGRVEGRGGGWRSGLPWLRLRSGKSLS